MDPGESYVWARIMGRIDAKYGVNSPGRNEYFGYEAGQKDFRNEIALRSPQPTQLPLNLPPVNQLPKPIISPLDSKKNF